MPAKISQKSKVKSLKSGKLQKKEVLEKPDTRNVLANVFSRLFDPPVILSILTIWAVLHSDLSRRGFLFLFTVVPVFISLPLLYFLWLLKTHKVHNWDITNRRERIRPLLMFVGFLFIDILVISVMDRPVLLNIFILYFVWMIGFFLITLFWKISGHSGVTTLACGVLLLWYGIPIWPVFLAVICVSWARIVRHDHTPLQVVAGIIYSLLVLSLWHTALPL